MWGVPHQEVEIAHDLEPKKASEMHYLDWLGRRMVHEEQERACIFVPKAFEFNRHVAGQVLPVGKPAGIAS